MRRLSLAITLALSGSCLADPLQDCGQKLEAQVGSLHSGPVTTLLSLDAGLYQMLVGADAVVKNARSLNLQEPTETTPLESRHLYWNAVEGCESYVDQLRGRLYYFMAVASSAALTLLVGLYYLFLRRK